MDTIVSVTQPASCARSCCRRCTQSKTRKPRWLQLPEQCAHLPRCDTVNLSCAANQRMHVCVRSSKQLYIPRKLPWQLSCHHCSRRTWTWCWHCRVEDCDVWVCASPPFISSKLNRQLCRLSWCCTCSATRALMHWRMLTVPDPALAQHQQHMHRLHPHPPQRLTAEAPLLHLLQLHWWCPAAWCVIA